MPGIFYSPVPRREFLSTTVLGSTMLALTGCRSLAQPAANAGSLHLALISDTHIAGDHKDANRGFIPWDNLQRAVGEVAAMRPEAVVLNGDGARLEGKPEEYTELRSALEPLAAFAPVYIGLGNHDDRGNFNKAFPAQGSAKARLTDRHVLVLEEGFMRIVILDSLLYTNKTAGLLGRAQRAWLAEFLATHSDRPIAIFVHHTLGDEDGELLDAPRLFEMVKRHPQVKAIFYGHSHVWEIKRRDNLHLINLPAVAYNFKDGDPLGWVDARFDSSGVDLTLHVIAEKHPDHLKVRRLDWA